jgi:hypothetical protein
MSPAEALVAQLDVLAWRLDRAECPPREEMEALADRAAALAPDLAIDDRRRLSVAVARVSDALSRSCVQVTGRIRTLGAGRRAARAYGGGSDASRGGPRMAR